VSKKTTTFCFLNNCRKLTDFNDFWHVKSWENLTGIIICPPHLSNVATLPWEIPKNHFQQHYSYILLITYHRRNTQLFNSLLSKTTWIGRYQMKQSPRHTLPDHQTSFINFLHLVRSTASSLFSLCACQSFSTTSVRVLFGLSLGSWTLYFILHTFLHPTIIFFSQHMPMPLQPVLP